MSELLDLARSVAARAGAGEAIEAFLTHEREFQVKVYMGDVESLSAAEPRGAGVRVVSGRRVGFAFTTDLSHAGLDAAIERARENSEHSTEDDGAGLAPEWDRAAPEMPELVDDASSAAGPDVKVAFAIELERAARSADPRIRTVEEAVYADSDAEVAIATSTGVSGIYRRTDAWCYALAIATEGDDTEIGFEFDLQRGLAGLDAERIGKLSSEKALSVLGASKIPSARMPIVLDPYTSGQFLGVIAQALTGEAVQKGRSLFAGKIGEPVADARVTLVDDGRLEAAAGSAPWDDEGVLTRRTEVISRGRLSSFLYDLTSARREGRESTGNASRAGFKSTPGPAPTNLAIDPTGETRDDILRRADRALLVRDFHGVHSGTNAVSGDFSVGVTGRLIENGEFGRPVKEVTIAAPMLDILARIEAVGDDRRWLPFGGSYGGATTLVSEMTVAGSS